ncbi:MAG TPA: alpha-mannosidase [Firmicutes bacterium]|nr:alpha-mannosidase [Bacillota bacterium]
MKEVHLICNAHIDPVWLWEWEEGLAETLSTFRVAADFCEEFDGFVFNHNESLLYEWVEQYDPALFERIQRLVAQGRWHIMGGWYLQPDCNMPSGEAVLRQIATGRRYFMEKFGKAPTTCINFDSFGHSRGLVQILAKSGYDSYLFTRPNPSACGMPAADFRWVGYDGSSVMAHIADEGYNSLIGTAAEKVRGNIAKAASPQPGGLPCLKDRILVLWGIGDHGGGPSRRDLADLDTLKEELAARGIQLIHSTPEAYFSGVDAAALPEFAHDLNPSMVGCYTSQVRIKQKHRQLESLLFSTEKTAAAAALRAGFSPDTAAVEEAQRAMLFNEFHDILPGTTIRRAEEAAMRSLDGGIALLQKERLRAFMALAAAQPQSPEGDIPVLVFNPHPYPVKQAVSCEFQLQNQNWGTDFTDFEVWIGGEKVPSQLEKEDSSIPLDWRKRIVFEAELPPFAMTQAVCRPVILPARPVLVQPEAFRLESGDTVLEIDAGTGLIARYETGGACLLKDGSGRLLVVEDNVDPWGMTVSGFPDVAGAFRLATGQEAGEIAGLSHPLPPVRVIEDGAVRTVVEAIFTYRRSAAIVHYIHNKHTAKIEIDVELLWMEPGRMVKLSLLSALPEAACRGQVMFGRDDMRDDGNEFVFQQWVSLENDDCALLVSNTGSYAGSFCGGELRLTLLRSAAYSAHPIENRPIVPEDRYLSRIDIGKRQFHFSLEGGRRGPLTDAADRRAQVENEPPYALSFFPSGQGGRIDETPVVWDNDAVVLTAFFRQGGGYVLRVFNPTGREQTLAPSFPGLAPAGRIRLSPFEARAYYASDKAFREIPLYGAL